MATPASDSNTKGEPLETTVEDMHLKEEEEDTSMASVSPAPPADREPEEAGEATRMSQPGTETPRRQSRSPVKKDSIPQSPAIKDNEEVVGGDVTLKLEPGRPPKLSRTTSRKVERRAPPLFNDYEDKTAEATSTFGLLEACTYANKHMGETEPALECDCAEEWDASTQTNNACGEDSDCINRATRMECGEDCGCGAACQNQRFTRRQFADVTVIKTEKKGHGLRANTDLRAGDFIFEYIGEVIGENAFRKRMRDYDQEGIKHFYFMSLTKGEFVDATKKGNLGRFCNHSCNPNCYVDKWVVGDKLRMGIFAERNIQAGEELVFNYNVDRYGADPQPCYCGEPNCTGFIGGKTQTERATKLSNTIIEALGIDDADAWDTAVAKRPRKKKASEDDEEYVNNVEPRGLDEEGVNKVMSSLIQCKEKWIAVKLLSRIQRADNERVWNTVVRFHGYRILKTCLTTFYDDVNLCLQILDVLDKMPRITRNKITDSKIEDVVQPLTTNEDERVSGQAKSLLEAWSKLEIGYRIPRMKRDPNAALPDRKADRVDRRGVERPRSPTRSKSPEPIKAPTGPKSAAPQRVSGFRPPPRRWAPPPPDPLPPGWHETTAANGSIYYWNDTGASTWQRPSMPAVGAPPPPPPKAIADQMLLQDLINNIVAKKEAPKPASTTVTPAETPQKERKEEKWRALPLEKQQKIYSNTINPHVMKITSRYSKKLKKEDVKRYSKDVSKLIVASDYKKGKVQDPSQPLNEKQIAGIKKYVVEFFDKVVKGKEAHEAAKAAKAKKSGQEPEESTTPIGSPPATAADDNLDVDADVDVEMANDQAPDITPATETPETPSALKRRYEDTTNGTPDEAQSKKTRTDSDATIAAPPPPPPPPPPLDAAEDVSESFTHEALVTVHAASKALATNGHLSEPDSTMQMATPPTTGSPDAEEAEKESKRQSFAGMNPDRMRQLGLYDGAAD